MYRHWAQWHIPVVTELWEAGAERSLLEVTSLRPAWATYRDPSQRKEKEKNGRYQMSPVGEWGTESPRLRIAAFGDLLR
jgi:hypothetical protein